MFAVELLIHENLIENSKSLKCWNEGASPQKWGCEFLRTQEIPTFN